MENTNDLGNMGNKEDKGDKGKGGLIIFFIFIYLLSAGVLAYGAYQYGLYKGAAGGQLSVTSDQLVGIPTTDSGPQTTVVPTIVIPTTDNRQQTTVTPKPMVTVKPKPSSSPTVTPTSSNLINYKYQLPSGWQVVQATDASFEMGFDPSTTKPKLEGVGEVRVVRAVGDSLVTQVKLVNYGGTDKKSFILSTAAVSLTEQNKMSNYKEVEFAVDGKNCYFIEGLNITNYGQVMGMCDAGGGKAFWVNIWSTDYLQVVRSLKRLR